MDIKVIHNHLADPGDRASLLLAHQGNRTIEIVHVEGEYVVRVITKAGETKDWKTQNVWTKTFDEAAAVAHEITRIAC